MALVNQWPLTLSTVQNEIHALKGNNEASETDLCRKPTIYNPEVIKKCSSSPDCSSSAETTLDLGFERGLLFFKKYKKIHPAPKIHFQSYKNFFFYSKTFDSPGFYLLQSLNSTSVYLGLASIWDRPLIPKDRKCHQIVYSNQYEYYLYTILMHRDGGTEPLS